MLTPRAGRPLARRTGRRLVHVTVLALVGSLLALLPVSPAAAAGPAIVVAKTSDGQVLLGGAIGYTLRMTNPAQTGARPEYNVSFRDVLPAGVTYVAGSTTPSSSGEPRVVTATNGVQTLIWSNLSDLPVGASTALSFRATPSTTTHPVGATVTNVAQGFAQSDPRTLPRFDADGVPVASSYTETASSSPATTRITALRIEKSEPSPENELLRGIHEHSTVYTLRVTNNSTQVTQGVSVVEYLPAGLEFLGCGATDNTAAGTVEYPGAPRLDVSTPSLAGDCPLPATVSTVTLSGGNAQGLSAGVYTVVTWSLANLGANSSATIRYRAGIPQRANVPFVDGPSAGSRLQAANLDNNTGPSTREGTAEQALTSLATVTGTYQGPVASGASRSVSDSARLTVTAEDLALQKSVTPTGFEAGQVATFTFRLRTGEYADASDVVLTDLLPDGLCPLDTTTNHAPGSPEECAPGPGFTTTGGTSFDEVVSHADGTYSIRFAPIDLAHDGTATVTFPARMRAEYAANGDPTVSGDGYLNRVSLRGTTTMRAEVEAPEPGEVLTDVRDESEASLSSDAPRLTKTMKPVASPYACGLDGTYTDNDRTAANSAALTFAEGDRICFKIRVDFSEGNATKDAVVTDFLPSYVAYEAGSATATANNSVLADLDTTGPLTWTIGAAEGGGRFVGKGAVFEYTVAGIVTAPSSASTPDITANLAKLSWTDTAGEVGFLRDQVDFSVALNPPLAISKTATRGGATVANNDTVGSGEALVFTVGVRHTGSAADRNAVRVVGPDVWDVLPAGISCALVTGISDLGVCTDPQDSPPSYAGNNTLSAIRWNLPDTVTIEAGATRSLTYTMTIPTDPRVGTRYTNTAAVASFATMDNTGRLGQHYPAENIDTSVTPAMEDTIAAQATFTGVVPSPVVAKVSTTATTPTSTPPDPSNAENQVVIGEDITYTVSLTVPAHTTIHNATVTDPMPTGVELRSASVKYSADADGNGEPESEPSFTTTLPSGVVFSPVPGVEAAGTATLALGSTYVNSSDEPQMFRITIQARATTTAVNVHNVLRNNTATLRHTATTATGSTATTETATSGVTVVEPAPTLKKTNDTTGDRVVAGQTVTYTLTAGNPTGRPILHDTWVVDCVPDGLTLTGVTSVPGGDTTTQTAGNGQNGCAAGQTVLRWQVGDLSGAEVLRYTAVVSSASAGLQSYHNAVTLAGSSLRNGTDAAVPEERSYGASASNTITVGGAGLAKSTSTPTRTIGQRAVFTTTATLPPGINFYDSAIVDTLPDGLEADTVVLTGSTCSPGCTVAPVSLTGDGQRIGWSLGDLLSSGAQRVVTLTYTALVQDVAGNKAGDVLANTAVLGWDLTDGPDRTTVSETSSRTSSPGAASVRVTEPRLNLAKTVSTSAPVPGQVFSYSVRVTSSSGTNVSAAHDVTLSDTVPDGVVVDPTSISHGGTITGASASGGGVITWALSGEVGAGSSQTLTYLAQLATPTPSGQLTNTARITGYRSLPGAGRAYPGESRTATINAALPRVVVAKSVVGGVLAYIGAPKTWQLTVTNDRASTAYGVDVEDTLPPNWEYVPDSARVSVRGATPVALEPTISGSVATGQRLAWTDLGNLPSRNDTVVVTLQAVPGAAVTTVPGVGMAATHTNTVSTTAEDVNGKRASADGVLYNGPAATAVARVASADLQVTKAAVGTPVAGRDLTWRVTVRNNGPDTAAGPITLVDTLPAQLTSVTATGTGWTCSGTAPVTCTRAAGLDSGALATVEVTGRIPAGTTTGTELTNRATVGGPTYDPAPANNETSNQVTVTTDADLAIDKELTGAMTAGTVATYTLDVTNRGPSVHRGSISVTDEIPAGTTFVGATGEGWSCAEAAGTLTCSRTDEQAVGPVGQVSVRVRVDPARTAAVVNRAVVDGRTSGTPDSVTSNDADQTTTTPATAADLSVDKVSRGTFTAGQPGTYRITVRNAGPSVARGVVVTDTLPAGTAYSGATSVKGAWDCSATGRAVRCELAGTLGVDGDAVLDVVVDVDAAHTGNLRNTATVQADTPEPAGDRDNNSDTDDTTGAVDADLRITKSHPAGEVVAGETVSYTVTVTNDGPSVSGGPIRVTDTLPEGLSCVTVDGEACQGGTAQLTRVAPLAPNASFSVVVVARAAASAGPATLTNRALVAGPDDTDPTNDSAQDPTEVVDRANVSLAKSPDGDTVRAGTEKTFTLTAHNDGPSDADSVSVTELLPSGMSMVSMSGTGWTCTPATATCTRATLAAGADSTIQVVVAVDAAVADGSTLTNTARISTSTGGDDARDNTASADIDVIARADLVIAKTHATGTVTAGEATTYDIDVHNDGPSDALTDLVVTDTLPDSMSFLAADNGWDCTPAGRVVTCELAEGLASGADAPTLRMRVHVAADADETPAARNEAGVTSPTTDPDHSDNTHGVDVAITRAAALTVTKSHTGDGRIGSEVAFTMSVRNEGPSTARGLVLTDQVPSGLEFVSADGGPDWSCQYAGASATVTCEHDGPLAAVQDAEPVVVTAAVTAAAYPRVTNLATVESVSSAVPVVSNEDTVEVPPLADLSLVKEHRAVMKVGQQATYTLTVHNAGPTEAPGTVSVSDALPDGLAFVSGQGKGWTCAEPAGTVTCTRAGLAAGETSTVELVVDVGPAAYPSVTNLATVTSPAEDPEPANNSSTDQAPVHPAVDLSLDKSVHRQSATSATWALTVTSEGPSATVDPVTVVDQIPSGLRYESARGPGWDCQQIGSRVTCLHEGTMAAGASSTILLTTAVAPAATGPIRNVASVTGGWRLRRATDVSEATLTPGDPAASAAGSAAIATGSSDDLPDTGGPVWWPVPLGAALVLAGWLVLRRGQRGRSRTQA